MYGIFALLMLHQLLLQLLCSVWLTLTISVWYIKLGKKMQLFFTFVVCPTKCVCFVSFVQWYTIWIFTLNDFLHRFDCCCCFKFWFRLNKLYICDFHLIPTLFLSAVLDWHSKFQLNLYVYWVGVFRSDLFSNAFKWPSQKYPKSKKVITSMLLFIYFRMKNHFSFFTLFCSDQLICAMSKMLLFLLLLKQWNTNENPNSIRTNSDIFEKKKCTPQKL